MKVFLFNDDGVVNSVDEFVYGIEIQTLSELKWSGGHLTGINLNYALVEDSYPIKEGDIVNVDDFLPQMKEQRKAEVNNNVGAACTKGFTSTTTGLTYDTDVHDQDNFTRRMLTVIGNPAVTSVKWKVSDGTVYDHTREQFLAVCNELDEFITSKVNTGWYIKNNLIEKALSASELKNISLEVE